MEGGLFTETETFRWSDERETSKDSFYRDRDVQMDGRLQPYSQADLLVG